MSVGLSVRHTPPASSLTYLALQGVVPDCGCSPGFSGYGVRMDISPELLSATQFAAYKSNAHPT